MNVIDQDTRIGEDLLLFREYVINDWTRRDALARSPCLSKLISGIHDGLFDPGLRINELLRDLHLSPSYVYELFRTTQRSTPHEYLEGLRIQAAMRLLLDPEFSITAIGFAVGYSNYRTFARAFTRLVGVCPKTHREQLVVEAW